MPCPSAGCGDGGKCVAITSPTTGKPTTGCVCRSGWRKDGTGTSTTQDENGAFNPPWNDGKTTSWKAWCAFEAKEGCTACTNLDGAAKYCRGTCATLGCRGFVTRGITPKTRYRPYDDIPRQPRSYSSTNDECRNRCAGVARCAYWTRWSDGGCHLASVSAVQEPNKDSTSGTRSGGGVGWYVHRVF